MNKKQLQQLIIIIPIILVGGIFSYHKYLLSPLKVKHAALQVELDKILKEYEGAVVRAARLPGLRQEIGILNKEIVHMQKKLPPTKDVPGFIRMLSKRMEHHRIRWTKISPGPKKIKEYYIEHTYTIPFLSSYHNLANFLTEIGQMERIFATKFKGLKGKVDTETKVSGAAGNLVFLIYTSK